MYTAEDQFLKGRLLSALVKLGSASTATAILTSVAVLFRWLLRRNSPTKQLENPQIGVVADKQPPSSSAVGGGVSRAKFSKGNKVAKEKQWKTMNQSPDLTKRIEQLSRNYASAKKTLESHTLYPRLHEFTTAELPADLAEMIAQYEQARNNLKEEKIVITSLVRMKESTPAPIIISGNLENIEWNLERL